jgi:hypothetical protein
MIFPKPGAYVLDELYLLEHRVENNEQIYQRSDNTQTSGRFPASACSAFFIVRWTEKKVEKGLRASADGPHSALAHFAIDGVNGSLSSTRIGAVHMVSQN